MTPRHLASLCLLGVATACGASSHQARSPRQTVEEYAVAIREGRLQDAYALLSSDAKRQVDFKTFEQIVRTHGKEMDELSTALLSPSVDPTVTAVVTGPSGETLTLYYEDGAWRVDATALDLYSQATPRDAVGAFVRAFQNRRYDVLMRFVPDDRKEGLDVEKLKQAWEGEQRQEMEQLTQALGAALPTAKFERVGDRATMSYGAGGTVELKLEADRWKIEEF